VIFNSQVKKGQNFVPLPPNCVCLLTAMRKPLDMITYSVV